MGCHDKAMRQFFTLLWLCALVPAGVGAEDGCRIGGSYPFSSPTPCNEDIRSYLEEIGECNALYNRHDEASKVKMKEMQCDTLFQVEEVIVIEYEDDAATMKLIDDYFDTHGLKIDFPEGDADVSVNCSTEGAYPFEVEASCPDSVRDYLQRTGDCTHFVGEDAYDEDRAAFLKETMQQLRCDQLAQDYTEIWSHYEGDVLIFRLIDRFHSMYDIPTPERLHYD